MALKRLALRQENGGSSIRLETFFVVYRNESKVKMIKITLMR